MKTALFALSATFLSGSLFVSCTPKDNNNTLSDAEKSEGWELLFDGKTLTNWKGFNDQTTDGWLVEEGCLTTLGKEDSLKIDLVTINIYKDFELAFDWKIAPQGNSGVFYHVLEGGEFKAPFESGPEYQLIDDLDYPDPLNDWQKTAADYAMYPRIANDSIVKPANTWNNSKIIFNNGQVEHWLNGEKVVAFEAWTEDWLNKKENGKWANIPTYGSVSEGRICLQNYGKKAWFRNIKIKKLNAK